MTFMRCIVLIWLVQVMYDAKIGRWYWEARDDGTLLAMSIGNYATKAQAQAAADFYRRSVRHKK